ncbi:M15 family metallopeptidase [Terrarubrum flagellatum]|uniref:M15 family metallopeptidase n=1 Tax=Terrirubrum flagellatum TaxID=2895980 RepID=UPI00314514B7
MPAWPSQSPSAMNEFYGDPDSGRDGRADPAWMSANLVRVKPPYRMRWSWGGEVATLTVHKKCAESLLRVLDGVAKHYGSQDAIEQARMHLCGGAFNFRLKRGGSTLSIHSWGAAIDLDPERNAFGRRYRTSLGMMPQPVVELFAAEGWEWGGLWSKPDAMHFQAAKVGAAAKPQPAPTGRGARLIEQVFSARSTP